MDKVIIYQVDENAPKKTPKRHWKLCSRICSYFNFLGFKKTDVRQPYQIEIDSPKYMSPVTKRDRENLSTTRKSVVLDLDETLVHSSFKEVGEWDFSVDITVQGIQFKIFVSVRPGASEFIELLSEHYDVILFTASLKEYADPVMDILDVNKRAVQRLFREHCVTLDNALVKDLRVLEKDLSSVIIIDNSDISFRLQPENAIHIKDYFYDKTDKELPRLLPFLVWLASAEDVRPVWKHKAQYDQQANSISSSNRQQSFAMEQQFMQYEDQHIMSLEERSKASRKEQDPSSRDELIDKTEHARVPSHSSKVKTKMTSGCSKTISIQINPNTFDQEPDLQIAAKINSPASVGIHFEMVRRISTEGKDEIKKQSLETSELDDQRIFND